MSSASIARSTPETEHMFNDELIGKMKPRLLPRQYRARGKICDRDAVARALESGQLAGYAGDVWFPQPAPNDHPWRSMPNHAMTPHTFGTVAAFSTMWGKHHSTGGQGGVLFTRDAELYRTIRGAADRGKPFGDTLPAGRNYLASLNFNQDELSAAIGRAQLAKLPAAAERRRAFVRALAEHLTDVASVQVPDLPAGAEPSWWFLRLRYRADGQLGQGTVLRGRRRRGGAGQPHLRRAAGHLHVVPRPAGVRKAERLSVDGGRVPGRPRSCLPVSERPRRGRLSLHGAVARVVGRSGGGEDRGGVRPRRSRRAPGGKRVADRAPESALR